jgi:hypothetical protein
MVRFRHGRKLFVTNDGWKPFVTDEIIVIHSSRTSWFGLSVKNGFHPWRGTGRPGFPPKKGPGKKMEKKNNPKTNPFRKQKAPAKKPE